MYSSMSQASEYAAGDPPPERVHVGEPKDLFPAPFVGQRVALRTPSRGPEVRLSQLPQPLSPAAPSASR